MRARRETTTAALGRLRADSEAVARTLAAGRLALPALAMGSDPESVVHVGLGARGDVVRVDLDPHWRDTLASAELGLALTAALHQAAEIRTGDWAAAVAADQPRPVRPTQPAHDPDVPTEPSIAVDPGWEALDDDALRASLLGALARRPDAPALPEGVRPRTVRDLEDRLHLALTRHAQLLPQFLADPVHASLSTVHDGVREALDLPLAHQALASPALGAFATRVRGGLALAARPGGLPEASEAWTTAAVALTSSLADAGVRRSPLGRLRGHAV